MSGAFAVDFSDTAKDDIDRLFEFLLLRARVVEDFERVQEAIDELRLVIEGQLARAPFNYRKSGSDPLRRELVVPVGATGYVALYDIRPPSQVLVLAVRHQREDDYH
jgi:plasmid stabilization system protein ParE